MLFLIASIVFGLVFTVSGVRILLETRRFLEDSVRTDGTIIGLREERFSPGAKQGVSSIHGFVSRPMTVARSRPRPRPDSVTRPRDPTGPSRSSTTRATRTGHGCPRPAAGGTPPA